MEDKIVKAEYDEIKICETCRLRIDESGVCACNDV